MPSGAFLGNTKKMDQAPEGQLKIALPIEFQAYNYFRITYVKNNAVYIGEKLNDSTLVFLPRKLDKEVGEGQARVEAAIIPFAEKN